MEIGDKVYRPLSLDINDIDEYIVIGIEGDTIILPDKVYPTNHRIKLSDINKKRGCFFTTYENAVNNILHKIQKGIMQSIKPNKNDHLKWYLDKEAKFIEDIKH